MRNVRVVRIWHVLVTRHSLSELIAVGLAQSEAMMSEMGMLQQLSGKAGRD